MFCPNEACPERARTGEPAEYAYSVETCARCGARLVDQFPETADETPAEEDSPGFCPRCMAPRVDDLVFCGECGLRLSERACTEEEVIESSQRSFAWYGENEPKVRRWRGGHLVLGMIYLLMTLMAVSTEQWMRIVAIIPAGLAVLSFLAAARARPERNEEPFRDEGSIDPK